MFDVISRKVSFTEKEVCVIMKQLMSAICYTYQNGIVYRDLKLENILLENDIEDLSIKLIDWGYAKTL